MTVIVQQPTDSNGNPQPMVYDSDTGKIIVDSNGYVINGGKRLVNIPTKADYVSTPKTQTAGIQEAIDYAYNKLENTYGKVSGDLPNVDILLMPGQIFVLSTTVHFRSTENQWINIHSTSRGASVITAVCV